MKENANHRMDRGRKRGGRALATLAYAVLCSLLALTAGCGGGGGGGGAAAPATVSGVAAAGAVITGTVSLKDSAANPKELTRNTPDGSFSFDVTGLTKPFVLKVSGTAAGTGYTLYSLAADQGTANINPMSNLVLAHAAGADPAALYASPQAAGSAAVAAQLPQALSDVQASLKSLLQGYHAESVNPITDSYKADGTGLDGALDAMKIEVSGGTVTVTKNGGTVFSASLSTGLATHLASGRVTMGGSALSGATVTVADAANPATVYGTTLTAADGSYTLSGIPQVSYTVSVSRSGYTFDRAMTTVAAADAAGNYTVPEFMATVIGTVSGRVTSANGGGFAGVSVTAKDKATGSSVSTVTDGNGRYSFSGLTTDKSYDITVSRTDVYRSVYSNGTLTQQASVAFDTPTKTVTINRMTSCVADFAANQAATFAVSGTITNSTTSAGMAKVSLILNTMTNEGQPLPFSDPTYNTYTTQTDANGHYSITGLPNGYYKLSAYFTGYNFAFDQTVGNAPDDFLVNGANRSFDFTGMLPGTGGLSGQTQL